MLLRTISTIRREHGEEIKQTSPLFRDKFDPIKGLYGHGKNNSKELNFSHTNDCSCSKAVL